MIKVLHTGDWHIGNFPGPEINGENARFNDICVSLDALAEGARKEQPDVIIIAGDVFHQARVWSDRGLRESQTAIDYINALRAIAPVVIIRGTPNHDSAEQFHMLEHAFRNNANVYIAMEPDVFYMTAKSGQKIAIAAVPGFDRGYFRAKNPGLDKAEENAVFQDYLHDIILGLKAQCPADAVTILTSHYTVDGVDMVNKWGGSFLSQLEPCIWLPTLRTADYDLCCFGHIHKPQQLDGCKNAFYCGAVTSLTFNDEGQDRGYYVHEIDDDKAVISVFYKLPSRSYVTLRLTDSDVAAINEQGPIAIEDCMGNLRLKDCIVRVIYDCTDEHNKAFNHATLEQWLYKQKYVFWVQEITPKQITISADKRSMDAENSPEDNLRDYLAEKEHTAKEIDDIVTLARPIISEAMEKAMAVHQTGLFVPVEIEVKNYRNYRNETFNFDDIRFCTINGNNGVGKSSLFMDAMVDALYEETREGDLTGWICNDPDVRSGSIKFTFRIGDKTYRVTRTRQKSGKATLNIAELVDGEWQDRSMEKLRDTQAEIINIIGMDSLTLKACALIMQDQYGLFLQADKEARMNILGNILGLGIYGEMQAITAEKLTEVNRELKTTENSIAVITAGMPDMNALKKDIDYLQGFADSMHDSIKADETEVDSIKRELIVYEQMPTLQELTAKEIEIKSKKQELADKYEDLQKKLEKEMNFVALEDEIKGHVENYYKLLDDEKECIASNAAYESAVQKYDLMEKTLKSETAHLEKLTNQKTKITQEIETLTTIFAMEKDLRENHEILLARTNDIKDLEQRLPAYHEAQQKYLNAKAEYQKLDSEVDAKVKTCDMKISVLKQKISLLANSGCNVNNAQCQFMIDARTAKENLKIEETQKEHYVQAYSKRKLEQLEIIGEAQKTLQKEDVPAKLHELLELINSKESLESATMYQKLIAAQDKKADYEEQVAELDAQIAECSKKVASDADELREMHAQVETLQNAAARLNKIQTMLKNMEYCLQEEKELPAAKERAKALSREMTEIENQELPLGMELNQIAEQMADRAKVQATIDEFTAKLKSVEKRIEVARNSVQESMVQIGKLQKQLEDCNEKMNESRALRKKANEIAVQAAAYEELKKAFSQDGIPHNIIRSVIPIFEATATNILGQMSQGHMSVEFVLDKVLKSNNKKEVTTLDIIINDSQTGRLPYMSRSGGERVKAALSVILALAEIKSNKAGVQMGFLFIDEPPFLDAPGVQAYCDALEAIQRRYPDLKVMAITHDPAMKSRFPQSIDVIKKEDGSKVIM